MNLQGTSGEAGYTITVSGDHDLQAKVAEVTGMESKYFENGDTLTPTIDEYNPVAVILDLTGSVSSEGLGLITTLKKNWPLTPIILTTNGGGEEQQDWLSEALMLGADDFVETPLREAELASRLTVRRDVLARKAVGGKLTIGDLTINTAHRAVRGPGGERFLSPTETSILAVLADAKGAVVPRDVIKRRCWGPMSVSDNALNRKLYEVRRSLKEITNQVTIRTIYGVGFVLESKAAKAS